ncbi:MAG: 2-polyprenylphenol 6-hydroxylase, partial [Rhodospirillaceae bacterium]|nr:2-polyprenylphenol 6-hydroxylase [Rhodospirillaceae bacterium]
MEMDLRFEAAAASELQDNFFHDEYFIVPDVDWATTGKRVLTTSRVHGMSIVDVDAIKKAGLSPLDILEKSSGAFFMQVFRDGFFHADMHPGNVFITPEGAIAVVDFGIMGRLDKSTRIHLAELLMAFLTRNYRRAAEVHFEAGWIPYGQSVDEFTQACRSIAEPVLDKPQNEISIATLLGQLFQITEAFQMETQPQLLLLQKTMLVAEGAGRKLAPEANMWFIARPLIEGWMRENLGPEARIKEAAIEAGAMLKRLPRLVHGLEQALTDFEREGLKLHPDTLKAMRGQRAGMGIGGGKGTLALVLAGAMAVLAIFALAL